MSTPVILILVWLLVGNLLAMLPSKQSHWPQAIVLIVTGIPLLIWVFWAAGPWIGLLALAAGLSVLRWPVKYAAAWVVRRLRG